MSKRKAIGKKIRFEVFKRDKFTCQYCGEKSPDVILHIDHINPVAEGGGNDIINLITSCVACNLASAASWAQVRICCALSIASVCG
jgi:5-methylcytosine-specific restriction endonuclease McrA